MSLVVDTIPDTFTLTILGIQPEHDFVMPLEPKVPGDT
jgi:hypothetical protein